MHLHLSVKMDKVRILNTFNLFDNCCFKNTGRINFSYSLQKLFLKGTNEIILLRRQWRHFVAAGAEFTVSANYSLCYRKNLVKTLNNLLSQRIIYIKTVNYLLRKQRVSSDNIRKFPFCSQYFNKIAVTFFFNAAADLTLFLIDIFSENACL